MRTVGLTIAGWMLTALPGAGQEKAPSEYEVKAAYLLNFAKFTGWPDQAFSGAASPIVLGVVGRDPFGDILDRTLAGQKVAGRGFEIRRGGRLQDIGACHMVFVSKSETEGLEAILDGLRDQPALTVSDVVKFASLRGMIGFFAEGKKIRFEANPVAIERAGIKLSSKLLNLARIVKEN